MSFAGHIGQEAELQSLGRTWGLSRWTRKVWREFLVYAQTVIPSPVEAIEKIVRSLQDEIYSLTDEASRLDQAKDVRRLTQIDSELARRRELQQRWVREAADRAGMPLTPHSEAVTLLLSRDPLSQAVVLGLLLKENHPEVTEDVAFEILQGADQNQLVAALLKTRGLDPNAAPLKGAGADEQQSKIGGR